MLTGSGRIAMRAMIMMMVIEHSIGAKNCLIFGMLLHAFRQPTTADMLVQAHDSSRTLHHPLQVM